MNDDPSAAGEEVLARRAPALAPGSSLVGRQADLRPLRLALAAAVAGEPAWVAVAGEAGIGKTRLAEELGTEARRDGALVVWASCWDGAGAPALWPWVQVVRACLAAAEPDAAADEQDDDVVAPARRLVAAWSGRTGAAGGSGAGTRAEASGGSGGTGVEGDSGDVGDAGDPASARFRLFEAVSVLLARAAEQAPALVVVLDDLHWADVPSLHLLRFVLAGLRSAPARVLVVGTWRDTDVDVSDEAGRLLAELGAAAESRVALAGLGRDEVGEVLRMVTGVAAAPAVVATVHERSGGNPLFARELAGLLRSEDSAGGSTRQVSVPDGVRAVLERRLARLTQPCVEVLAVAAVIGHVFGLDVLAGATDLARVDVLARLDEAVRSGLVVAGDGSVGRYRFSHALVRDVVYERLPLDRRAALHLRVAGVLEPEVGAGGGDPADLAHHFVAAAPVAGAGPAITWSVRAAQRAFDVAAYEDAAGHYRRALDVAGLDRPDPDRRSELTFGLGEALLRAGSVDGARAAFADLADDARRRGRPYDLARAALGFSAGMSGFEVRILDQAQVELLEEALAAIGDRDPTLRAWLLGRLSVALSYSAPLDRRRRLADEAVELARASGDPSALAHALAAHCDTIAGPDEIEERLVEAREIVTLAETAGDRPLGLLGRRLLVEARLEAGDLAGADTEIAVFDRLTDPGRDPAYAWYVPLWRGMRALADGDLATARRLAADAAAIGARADSSNADMLANGVLTGMVQLESGEADQAVATLEALVRRQPGIAPGDYAGLTPLFVAEADPVRAAAALDALGDRIADLPRDSELIGLLGQVAEAAALVGHHEVAAAALPLLAPHAGRFGIEGIGAVCRGSVARHVALLEVVLGLVDDALVHFARAAADNRRAGAHLPLAHTLRDHGAALLARDRSGDREQAAELLAEAAALYGRFGLVHRVAAVERLRPDVSGPPTGAAFVPDGELWTLTYAGSTVHLKDRKGLRDLAVLLASPGRDVAALDLAAARGPRPAGAVSARADDGLTAGAADLGEVLDPPARAAYRSRLADLEGEIDEAEAHHDLERASRARAERDFLAAELAAAVGLGGRPRHAGDPAERARTTVTWRIRDTIRRIEREHPALGQHLQRSVRTGTLCRYDPDDPQPAWRL